MKRKIIIIILSTMLLLAGWKAADRYLIEHVQKTGITAPVDAAADEESAASDTSQPPEEIYSADAVYAMDEAPLDEAEGIYPIGEVSSEARTISVTKTVTGTGEDKITCYVADVQVSSGSEIKSCFAKDSYGENVRETTSSMAMRCNAVFAVNGDYYGYRSDGIVIRNGVLYRDQPKREGLALYEDGTLKLYDETATTGQKLVDQGVWNAFTFGPVLVRDGKAEPGLDGTVRIDDADIHAKEPRTAIGQIEKNHFLFVVVEGRQKGYSRGMTLTELSGLMEDLGCRTAYNLDGGDSVTMYFDGRVVNHPSSKYSHTVERGVSDCVFIN